MRIATINQRLHLISGDGAIDVHAASGGQFGPDPATAFDRWAEFAGWASSARLADPQPFTPESLGSPSPAPRQIFAIGLNYGEHAAESGFARPDKLPPVFTKFASCIAGPFGQIVLPPAGHTAWEVELAVIMALRASRVLASHAWGYVAGLAVGQDV